MAPVLAEFCTCVCVELKLIIFITYDSFHILQLKLFEHAINKISFIAKDPNDNRAFGYIVTEKDGKHTYFGIRTEKTVSDLLQQSVSQLMSGADKSYMNLINEQMNNTLQFSKICENRCVFSFMLRAEMESQPETFLSLKFFISRMTSENFGWRELPEYKIKNSDCFLVVGMPVLCQHVQNIYLFQDFLSFYLKGCL